MALSCGTSPQPIEGSLPLSMHPYIHQTFINHPLASTNNTWSSSRPTKQKKRKKEALRFFRFSPFKTAARTKATIAKTNCGSALENKIKIKWKSS